MNQFLSEALAYLKEHWHTGMAGTSDAAYLLDINANTFKTRLARGQALVMRDPNGEQRSTLTFTGYHLIYNLIADRMLRYGFSIEHELEKSLSKYPHVYAEWVLNNVLSTPHHTDAILRLRKEPDGGAQVLVFENGSVEDWTGDAALIIPIGTMAVRLAATLYSRNANSHREHINRLVEAGLSVKAD